MSTDQGHNAASSDAAAAQVRQNLLQFVSSRIPDGESLDEETDLLEDELLDSLLIMDLVAHIESVHGVTLRNADLAPRNFRNVAALSNLVTERKA